MRAVMVATVKGPDTGASVVANILDSMPSYHFQGFVPGNGWVHLDEFAQRWLTLREKMTNPANPDYIHFSQFVATPDDGIAPDIEDSDFRTEAELFRRKVKPAWIQYFNTSKVMCAIRRLVIEANAPPPGHAFGFTHAFEDDGEQDDIKFAPTVGLLLDLNCVIFVFREKRTDASTRKAREIVMRRWKTIKKRA